MSSPTSRLTQILHHVLPSSNSLANPGDYKHTHHIHQLSPTFFLHRAAQIEPEAQAIYHVTSNEKVLTRKYSQFEEWARGLAYYIKSKGWKRVGVLAPNTPAHLESIFGIPLAGGTIVPVNYRLQTGDITYIFSFAEVEAIIVDAECLHLLADFKQKHPQIPFIVDTDTDISSGPFDEVIKEGLEIEQQQGGKGWSGMHGMIENENSTIAIPFTSGTTARPKGVEYTHRGAYLAAMANLVESGLNHHAGRCGYLWTLPMFHAMGWTFPWAVTAIRGTHFCLRRISYPQIWSLLLTQPITHFNAAPTVNTNLCACPAATRLPRPINVTVAASPPSAHLFQQMTALNLIPVHVYGLTETYGPITRCYYLPTWDALPEEERYARMARQGHGFLTSLPVRVIKIKQPPGVLIDVKRDGKEVGEIVFKGNICAKGYFKDAEATRRLWEGGWLHSGDLAVWYGDGSVLVVDRKKDVIISGGENISSISVESSLIRHPAILEAAVIAIPDKQWGERPKAYATLREGASLKGEELIQWAKRDGGVRGFMVPKQVEVVEELPKTSTGKVKKDELRERARSEREGG